MSDTAELEAGASVSRGISGSTIKMIALLSMLIDHTAATILEGIMQRQGVNNTGTVEPIEVAYYGMRSIGRLAFPIFIFLLIEGFMHTRNQWKYLFRLILFTLISEIPFDFAFNLSAEQIFSGQVLEFSYQNVFFTLSIGLLTIIGLKAIDGLSLKPFLKVLVNIGITAAGMGLAFLLHTDYGAVGVLAIVMMYLLRENKMLAMASVCIILMFSSLLEACAFLTLIPVAKYNGERGWKLKWIFYIFYPAHLLILWLICLWMGIA